MGKLQPVARSFAAGLLLLLTMQMTQSCIKEDLSGCENEELLLYVKVVDVVTGVDITGTGEMQSAGLYVFNRNKDHIRTYTLSALQIAQREPVIIHDYDPAGMWISAWGNIGDEVLCSEMGEGVTADDLTVSLKPDPLHPGYDLAPNDFFFARKEVQGNNNLQDREEIVFTQKNAKLQVTVRGLKDTNAANYYFEIINKFHGYDYRGLPISQITHRQEKGIFNSREELVSPVPWLFIHSANQNQATEEQSVWVHVYKEGSGEIIQTNRDTHGNYITLLSGKTTNVLIDLTGGDQGQFIVQVVISPWDEIHQWEHW